MKKYIALKDNLERIYLSDKSPNSSYTLKKEENIILIEHYEAFITVNINKKITIFYFFDEKIQKPFSDFIDITLSENYSLDNVLKGTIKETNIVIEGADGVGKSTLVLELANKGYLTQDRAVKEVTQKMRKEIPTSVRVDAVKKYLQADRKRKLVFLYLSDERELKRRIDARENISEYDKQALIFQRLYVDTYNRLSNFENLYIIDCLGKTPKELVEEIEKLI